MNISSSDLMSYCSLAKNNLSFREVVGIVFPSFFGFTLHILVIHSLLEMLLLVIEHCNQPLLATDGSSQNPGIVQSRTGGRLTHRDRHLNIGRRSEDGSTTPVHLGAVTEHLFPFAAVERTAHY